jgi:hypothetical protein
MKKIRVVSRLAALLLVVSQLSCGGGGDNSVAPPVATTITANSAVTLTGSVGTAVTPAPSVIVRDANGNAMAGVPVTFAVTAGGGSATGTSAVTNSSGVATVAAWTLGTTSGTNTLSASAGNLTPVVFTATGTPAAAASITKTAGDNQSAENGTAVPIPPAVTVRDANGNPVQNATIIFSIGTGGGTVSGGTQTTNASGVATVGSWILGAPIGANTLTAAVTGLPPVTFAANTTPRAACSNRPPYTIGTAINGELSTTDCLLDGGFYIDYFPASVTPAGSYVFSQSSPTFDTFVLFYGPDNFIVGLNDDDPTTAGTNSRMRALLPAANYTIGATSFDPRTTGSYTVSSIRETSSNITGCEEIFVARGVTTDQTLQTTDCLFNTFYSDDMVIFLRAGQQVTISMNSAAFDTALELYNTAGAVVASNGNRDPTTTNSQMVYTATVGDFFLIVPTSFVAGATGAYTLIVQ